MILVATLMQQNQEHQQQQQSQQQMQQKEMLYHQCNKGCGQEIYFDANNEQDLAKAANGFH
jgi:hypothetical protein